MEVSNHPYVVLARQAVRYYLDHGLPLPCPNDIPDELKQKFGAFVSIKKGGQLRGCIGTLTPNQPNLAMEIIRNAISAATKDPRFAPVEKEEMESLDFSVDVLSPMEKVTDPSELDCKRYGLVVMHEGRQGVLLPDIEGIDSTEDQIRICRRKAGIGNDEPVDMYRFQVKRYH